MDKYESDDDLDLDELDDDDFDMAGFREKRMEELSKE